MREIAEFVSLCETAIKHPGGLPFALVQSNDIALPTYSRDPQNSRIVYAAFVGSQQGGFWVHQQAKHRLWTFLSSTLREPDTSLAQGAKLYLTTRKTIAWADAVFRAIEKSEPFDAFGDSRCRVSLADSYDLQREIESKAYEATTTYCKRVLEELESVRGSQEPALLERVAAAIHAIAEGAGLTTYRNMIEVALLQSTQAKYQALATLPYEAKLRIIETEKRLAVTTFHRSTVYAYVSTICGALLTSADIVQLLKATFSDTTLQMEQLGLAWIAATATNDNSRRRTIEDFLFQQLTTIMAPHDVDLNMFAEIRRFEKEIVDVHCNADRQIKKMMQSFVAAKILGSPEGEVKLANALDECIRQGDSEIAMTIAQNCACFLKHERESSLLDMLKIRMLSRLLCGTAMRTTEIETKVLKALQQDFKRGKVHAMTCLLQDCSDSAAINEKCKPLLGEEKPSPQLSLRIIGAFAGSGCLALCAPNIVPRALADTANIVRLLYGEMHPKRRLSWLPLQSCVHVKWNHAAGSTTVVTTMLHFALLEAIELLANGAFVSEASVIQHFESDPSVVRRTLAELVTAHIVVANPSNSSQLALARASSAATVTVISQGYQIRQATATKFDAAKLDAAIVRLLKRHGSLPLDKLPGLLRDLNNKHLNFSATSIKECVARLIARDYALMDGSNIKYVA